MIAEIAATSFSNLTDLTALFLDDNKLKNLVLQKVDNNLGLISLTGNPLRCDCKVSLVHGGDSQNL